jgi:hypothetical protein
MKRILALIMVLAMVFAFAACKSKDDGATTTDPSSAGGEVIDNGDGSTVPADASAADSTDASNDASEVSIDASGKPVEAPSQAAGSQGGSQGGAQTGNTEKGLNSTDAKAVVAFYNKAVKASVKNPPKGKQTMKLEKLEGTGGLGKILGSFEGIAKKALEKNSTDTNYIPAGDHGDVLPTDVKNAKATNDGKYTTVSFDVKPQTDGPKESSSKGPVGRSIGTLGNVQNALDQLPGVSVTSGIENIKLTYDHAYVTVKIDNNTGKIVSGTWHYKVNVNVNNLGVKVIGIPASVDTLHGIVDYTVKIG